MVTDVNEAPDIVAASQDIPAAQKLPSWRWLDAITAIWYDYMADLTRTIA